MTKNKKKANAVLASKLETLSRDELLKLAKTALMPMNDPEQYKAMVRENMPDFVKEMETKEDMGTSIWQANQEFILVMADCLRRYHGWSDLEIKQLHHELTDVLTGVKEYEDAGLAMLSAVDIKRVGDQVEVMGPENLIKRIAEIRYKKAEMVREGIEYPSISAEEAFPKRIGKKK